MVYIHVCGTQGASMSHLLASVGMSVGSTVFFVLQSEQRFKFTYPQASDGIRLWDMVRISPLILASVADMLGRSYMLTLSTHWPLSCHVSGTERVNNDSPGWPLVYVSRESSDLWGLWRIQVPGHSVGHVVNPGTVVGSGRRAATTIYFLDL